MLIFLYNFITSYRSGAPAGNDPWGAPTIEWSIPSPPPEYNFARIPRITSRVPLWDLTQPRLSGGVPHTVGGDRRLDVDVGAKQVGSAHPNPVASRPRQAAEAPMHIEHATGKSAEELGIPMPNPTIKPMICAIGMTVMFTGLLFLHLEKFQLALMTIIGGALIMTLSLYAWVLTPLEDAH
jgi:hypothetical protein